MTDQLNIATILDRMMQRESGGRADIRGQAGEIGLLQVKPDIARHYGVQPELLTNPIVNRYVAQRYLTDLISQFRGNVRSAVEAYNAGPGRIRQGRIPKSTLAYARAVLGDSSGGESLPLTQSQFEPTVGPSRNTLELSPVNRVLRALGPSSAGAEEPPTVPANLPSGYMIPVGGGKPVPIPKGASDKPPAKPEPLLVRGAGWLPTVGQFVGEPLGAMAGAALPGAGETGIPEYLGATAGGAAGSALGAEAENAIRRAYGFAPVSVGKEAAWGGVGSAVGGLAPFVGRFRKAARIARQKGIGFGQAYNEAMNLEAGLEGKLGIGPRVAKLQEKASAYPVRAEYAAAKQAGQRELGVQYEAILNPFKFRPVATSAGANALAGSPGRVLELAGKPFRQSIQEEFDKTPKTVGGVQRLISLLKAKARQLNPDRDKAALQALGQIQKGLEYDRDQVIGADAAKEIKNIDYYYGEVQRRFPLSRVSKAVKAPEAAEQILKATEGETGRVVEMIDEMKRLGSIDQLRRATATRIFQKAAPLQARSPLDRMNGVARAVEGVRPDVFDALFGAGSHKEYLAATEELKARSADLLKHPNEARAIQHEVENYLRGSPGLAGRIKEYAKHRLAFDVLVLGGGYATEHIPAAIALILGVEGFEAVASSPVAVRFLRLAAMQKEPRAAARLLIAGISASLRTGGEEMTGGPSYATTDASR